ncbi:MAG: hypothetical protein A2Y13_08610 [Planctomycetes bacterium GWC2_45_44]|nr:MAG: hypothetical protein A2Y13_08610 [Planctomycetes bacterium GWC2_45_44]
MAKKAKGKLLFPEMNTAHYGNGRRSKPLFLPKVLNSVSSDKRITETSNYKTAYEIISKWADLETRGLLDTRKESNIEQSFVNEVFEQALGYTPFTENNKEEWDIDPKYAINGGFADIALGSFSQKKKNAPDVVVELKGSTVNVDRDRFDGRTAVSQCWDYLYNLPDCQWGNSLQFREFPALSS